MEKKWIEGWMSRHQEKYREISRKIWEFAELGMMEYQSAELLERILEEEGFAVERNLAGIPTAFCGRYGEGKPVVAILGEFDALEGLSQTAGTVKKEKRQNGKNGHGCGHNLLGTGSLAAAIALKDYMKEKQMQGTLVYYGCPGEEKGCGKVHMVQAGYFQESDAVLTWHPSDHNGIEGKSSLADLNFLFQFQGKAAHAASSPHLGRNALHAVELLNVGCNFMREHMIPEARIHYAITDAGGSAPNIVQETAAVLYEVRAPEMKTAMELRERICRAAKGAALMTDTEVQVSWEEGYSEYLPNDVLNRVGYKNLLCLVGPVFTKEEEKFAEAIRKTYAHEGKETLRKDIEVYQGIGGCMPVSTDVGDVSRIAPVMQLYTVCCAQGTPGHSWQMVSQSGSSIGKTGMFLAAGVLAMTGADLLENPELVKEAKEEHSRMTQPYICPLGENGEKAGEGRHL